MTKKNKNMNLDAWSNMPTLNTIGHMDTGSESHSSQVYVPSNHSPYRRASGSSPSFSNTYGMPVPSGTSPSTYSHHREPPRPMYHPPGPPGANYPGVGHGTTPPAYPSHEGYRRGGGGGVYTKQPNVTKSPDLPPSRYVSIDVSSDSSEEDGVYETRTQGTRTSIGKVSEFQKAEEGRHYPDNTVFINVYHLMPSLAKLNHVTSKLKMGVYHASVEVYGREWSFGATEDYGTGILREAARSTRDYKFAEALVVGELSRDVTLSHVKKMVRSMELEWQGQDYDLLTKNCIYFVEALIERLGFPKERIPMRLTTLMKIGGSARQEYYDKGYDKKFARGVDKIGKMLGAVQQMREEQQQGHSKHSH